MSDKHRWLRLYGKAADKKSSRHHDVLRRAGGEGVNPPSYIDGTRVERGEKVRICRPNVEVLIIAEGADAKEKAYCNRPKGLETTYSSDSAGEPDSSEGGKDH